MDQFSVHAASEAELEAAIQVRIRVFVEIQKFPLSEETDGYDSEAKHIVITNVSKNNVVIGTLRILRAGDAAKLGRVVVVPEYQGKGLGKRLIAYAEQYIALHPDFLQCTSVKLGSQFDKRGFYERCGYMPRGDIYDELGCPHIWMYKDIQRV
ncbi:hypothetical protein LPJ61_006653 [Coemansia biformis]|uniref:N-acetyltransferase domain-containing protein n=1 Tax=Coemansia biformis TaxID=1286918 RepID=A0A9W8CND8_9FUNG|nr:hypothetical protein LPJ61_006653 [Coemansia biformis]